MQRLSFPHSVAGAGAKARTIRREGAYVAWIFLMLFLLSMGAIMLALSATGLGFEDALIFAAAGLSTTGPLVSSASETGLTYAQIPDAAKAVLCGAMVLGRLEALAVIAILNPAYWRR
jgi:trk system potassium uptake protein TrkH